MSRWDVIALGETMLRLDAADGETLIRSRQYNNVVGGSETNTLAALSQLGRSCCWLSRVPDHDLGYRILREISSVGVETCYVCMAGAQERVGIFYLENTALPRTPYVIYDRANSAAANMQPGDLPASFFSKHSARLFHTSGISLGISQSMRDTAATAWQAADTSLRSFDFNYRGALWIIDDAWAHCLPLMQSADLVFISGSDLALLYGCELDTGELFSRLRKELPEPTLVLTLGAKGAAASATDAEYLSSPSLVQSHIGRIGRGDAFSAGFMDAWLDDKNDLATALLRGNQCAAHKSSTPGDMMSLMPYELEKLNWAGAAQLKR